MALDSKEYVRKQQFNLGDRLRAVRIEKGYRSAESFANEHGFNRVQVGRYENGANISWTTLVKIIRALDISIAEFFSDGFDEKPDL